MIRLRYSLWIVYRVMRSRLSRLNWPCTYTSHVRLLHHPCDYSCLLSRNASLNVPSKTVKHRMCDRRSNEGEKGVWTAPRTEDSLSLLPTRLESEKQCGGSFCLDVGLRLPQRLEEGAKLGSRCHENLVEEWHDNLVTEVTLRTSK